MTVWSELRIAARVLLKERGFTLAAVAALALGIAANNTVFTLINGIFLNDLPFSDPARVVAIGIRDLSRPGRVDNMSLADLQDLRASARTFDDIAGVDEVTMNLADPERAPERFIGSYITANGFALIGQRPALGRDFRADDDIPGATPVVILGHRIWQNRYDSDSTIVGRTIRVNGVASTVVGIMPEGFGFPTQSELWQPMGVSGAPSTRERGVRGIDGFGRLAGSVTMEQASAELEGIMAGLAQQYPASNTSIGPRLRPFRDSNTGGPVRTVTSALMGAVAFLLLIACANVANLLLARGATRARDISVRLSLGATRTQIVRQLLIESLLLASVAGALGLAIAVAGVRVVSASIRGSGEPYWLQFPLDWRVLFFFMAVCLATTVLFGLLPALNASRANLAGVINESARGATLGLRNRRWTGALVVVQLALTLVLMSGAGLMMRNVVAMTGIDAGIDTTNLVTMRIALPDATYPDVDRRRAFYEQLEARLAAIQGMRAGVGSWAPLNGAFSRRVSIEGSPAVPADERPRASNVIAGTGYFEALGVTPLRGQAFTRTDGTPGIASAIVNERFAAQHFPNQDPIGRRIELDSAGASAPATGPLTVVGVVPNLRHEDFDPQVVEPAVYLPLAAQPQTFAVVIVRHPELGLAADAVRGAIADLDPDLPVFNVMTLEDTLDIELVPFMVFGSMFVVFAGVALLLGGVGLYGVTAYSVAQRTREIGVRLALGAQAGHIWWVVTRRAALQLAIGLVIGIAGAFGVGQALQGVLTSISGADPLTLFAVPAVLIVVALFACIGPARRATRLNPIATLRAE
jgi:putative ABC transport system permease protein